MSERIRGQVKDQRKDRMEDQIKEMILGFGADVCGIASIDRFSGAPEGYHPRDIFPECKTVISFGIALSKGLAKVEPRLIYNHYNSTSWPDVDRIAVQAAKEIERRYGGYAVPMPCDNPYEYWDTEKMEGRGLLSMKHAAELAGLGRIGKSHLLLNHTYGNLLTLGAILTDIEMTADPLAESICIEGCNLCVSNCPSQAINSDGVIQLRCRQYTFGTNARGFDILNCNTCRTICPVRFGKQ